MREPPLRRRGPKSGLDVWSGESAPMPGFPKLRWVVVASALLLPIAAAVALPAGAAPTDSPALDAYSATVSGQVAAELSRSGLDVTASTPAGTKVRVDLVLTAAQAKGLRARGIDAQLKRTSAGKTARQLAAAQAAGGYTVYRSWDQAGGIRDELYGLARANPDIVKLEVLGHTWQGREIVALKVTARARQTTDGSRPAVLYSATQHAREWIGTEVDRRLLHLFLDGWNAHDTQVRQMLSNQEFWFVPVMNPDGYQYTFDHERLWRKNLRDNDGDGKITGNDGVDPNRNYPEHFRYDDEGSSSQTSSETYRGPSAGSEPETKAAKGLLDRVHFAFQVQYHSYGPYLLYPEGWQIGAPSQDDPIYYALSGNLDKPAIPDSHPGLGADVLYVTNGESTDFAHTNEGTLAWTPELEEGCTNCGFVFPDDEKLIQAEFEKQLPFALDVAGSAPDPANPVSHLGITTKPFYLNSEDTYKAGLPLANFTFDVSYGDPQEVRVLAKRSLGPVSLNYRINKGAPVTRSTSEWQGGDRYGGRTDFYYHIMKGVVTGTKPGDSVEVWFTGGGETSKSFTYRAAVESTNKVLVLAAEDYTGASPDQSPGPHYLSYYQDALAANGIGADVYDVDAMGRKAPDHLGVLSHYKGVIWYTGDDAITREHNWGPGNVSRLATDELLQVRDFMNEGGRVLYTGKYAGHQGTFGHGAQLYDPTEKNAQCSVVVKSQPNRCIVLAGSGDGMNDVLEYWLGTYLENENAGLIPETNNLFDVTGSDTPFTGLGWGFNGPDSAQNQDHSASFITTSGILDPQTYPQFDSWASAKYDRPGGPFVPHTGNSYAYSQIGDVSYKRLSHTISVPAGGGNLSFWVSHNTEQDWDYVFVEARTAGSDNWTTLPDLNGHSSTDTGLSCPAGWNTLHPQLDHYQTLNADNTCSATGTTGSWNAATGDSSGWDQWNVDLSAYAGSTAEVSITYASDWSSQGLGVFVDDVVSSTGEGTTSFEADGDQFDGWVPGGSPTSAPNPNNFTVTTAAGFPEGAAVSTRDSIYMGFGFEGITDAATRNRVMGAAVTYLLR
jgi:hypothetical protein